MMPEAVRCARRMGARDVHGVLQVDSLWTFAWLARMFARVFEGHVANMLNLGMRVLSDDYEFNGRLWRKKCVKSLSR